MIAWMLYCVVVTIVVAGAARAAESLARLCRLSNALDLARRARTHRVPLGFVGASQRFERHAPLTLVATVRDNRRLARRRLVRRGRNSFVPPSSSVERVVDGSLAVGGEIDRSRSLAGRGDVYDPRVDRRVARARGDLYRDHLSLPARAPTLAD